MIFFFGPIHFLRDFLCKIEGDLHMRVVFNISENEQNWRTLFIPVHPPHPTRIIKHCQEFKKAAHRGIFWKCQNMFLDDNFLKHKILKWTPYGFYSRRLPSGDKAFQDFKNTAPRGLFWKCQNMFLDNNFNKTYDTQMDPIRILLSQTSFGG